MTSPVVIPAGHKLLAADFDAYENLTGAWTDYSGSLQWTASVNPAIGNGTIDAKYMQTGRLVIYRGRIIMGSTTTFGSGSWLVSLPVNCAVTVEIGAAVAQDNSTPANSQPAAIRLSTATTANFFATGGSVSATVPFAWATSDQLRWTIVYEAAP